MIAAEKPPLAENVLYIVKVDIISQHRNVMDDNFHLKFFNFLKFSQQGTST